MGNCAREVNTNIGKTPENLAAGKKERMWRNEGNFGKPKIEKFASSAPLAFDTREWLEGKETATKLGETEFIPEKLLLLRVDQFFGAFYHCDLLATGRYNSFRQIT